MSFTKCSCQKCGNGIEFDESHNGEAIVCPHCKQPTVLKTARSPFVKKLIYALVILGLVLGSLIGIKLTFWRGNTPISVPPWAVNNPNAVIVNGQYSDKSDQETWKEFSKWENLGQKRLGANNRYEREVMSVNRIIGTNTVIVDVLNIESWPEKWTGIEQDLTQKHVRTVVVLNYPHPETLVTGEGIKCICTRTTNYRTADGLSFVAYDCGIKP